MGAQTHYQTLVKQGMDALAADSLMQAEQYFRQAMHEQPADRSNFLLFRYIGQIQEKQGKE